MVLEFNGDNDGFLNGSTDSQTDDSMDLEERPHDNLLPSPERDQ